MYAFVSPVHARPWQGAPPALVYRPNLPVPLIGAVWCGSWPASHTAEQLCVDVMRPCFFAVASGRLTRRAHARYIGT